MVSQKQICIKYKTPKTPYNIEAYLLIFKHETKCEKQCKRKIESKQERTLLLLVLHSSFVSQIAIVLNETNRKSWGKNKVFLARCTVLPVSFASMYFPPMHKGKNWALHGKGSARAELAERWKVGNLPSVRRPSSGSEGQATRQLQELCLLPAK